MTNYTKQSFLIFLSLCILQSLSAMENEANAKNTNLEIVQYLPKSPLIKNNTYGNTAFHVAAKNDKSEANIRALLIGPHFDFQNRRAQDKAKELYLVLSKFKPSIHKELIFKIFEVLPEDCFFTGLCKYLVKNDLKYPLITQVERHVIRTKEMLVAPNHPGLTAVRLLQKSVHNPQYVTKIKPLLTGQKLQEDLELLLTSSNLSDDNLALEIYNNYNILFTKEVIYKKPLK